MTIHEFAAQYSWRCVQPQFTDTTVGGAYTSDLLSDVMAHADEVELLITIQAHKNTVAVATLAGIRAIVLCNDRPVPPDMISAAAAEGIGLFVTDADQFTVSGQVYTNRRQA